MRRFCSPALLIMVVACGGGTPTTSPTGGTAAAITVVAGDGQQAEPGASVAVKPVVVVKDAAGHGVAGVGVSFVVDSGGGSLQAASATTAADGTASPGDWRLGTSEGRNVFHATVASLSPVLFHADGRFGRTRTLISNQVIGADGGTLRYAKPGDALNGLVIKVPANAYSGSTTWNVSADSTVAVPMPADFSQVGPVLVIDNEQGYANSLIAMTVPMRIAADYAVAPFFFDAATGTLEGVPLIARSDSNITFASRHFSGSLMAIPGSAPGPSGRWAALSTFGTIKMVFIRIPLSKLIGTFTSTFRPGQDDWEFTNNGDFQGPHGNCEGMTASALYYHYYFRATGSPPLFGRFDHFLTNDWDNVRGIHLSGALQADYVALYPALKAQREALRDVADKNGETLESLASTWILLNLKLTGHPLLIGVHGAPGSHAIVAYEATATAGTVTVRIADPNHPGVSRTLTYQGGNMVPLQFQEIATEPGDYFTSSSLFGVTSDIPLSSFNSRWAEFIAGSPGEDRLPHPRTFEVYDSVNATWGELPDTVRLVADTLVLRMRCPNCPSTFNGTDGSGLENLMLLNAQGTTQFDSSYVPRIPLAEGTRSFFATAHAQLAGARFFDPAYFLDGRPFTVIKGKLRLFPQSLSGMPDTVYVFTLTHGGLAKPDSRYVWNFGDGTPLQTVTGDSLRTHAYATLGNYTVTVEMRDGLDHLVGRTTSLVTISDVSSGNASWKFTATAVTFSSGPAQLSGYDSRWRADSEIVGRIALGVTQGGFRVVDQAFTPTGFPLRTAPVGVYLLEGASITLASLQAPATENTFDLTNFSGASLTIPTAPQVSGWNLVQQSAPVNVLCDTYDDSYVFSGTIANGHVTGLRVPTCVQSNDFPQINGQRLMSMDVDVTFSATTATGTISVIYYFYGNGNPLQYFQRVARLTFQATRVFN